ncbi:MAG: DUF4369 domain-containing protein [Bacteroides sp.]|nr:DUF4369 domain-containing protein [Roseburia sp.]MCM1346510.1 DUF4369 domain-containing protein [Bacteroides sp.]MCM1421062.1 DUF4369 domain-containing protein [Bacteroides sp.]
MKNLINISLMMSLVALLLAGCDSSDSSFKIKGTFRDMKAGNLYIYNKVSGMERFDTITIKNGEFVYGGTAQVPTPYILVFPNGVEQVIFVDGGEELRYEAAANDLKNYVVNGSELNKLMNRFRKETFKLNAGETQKVARQYILQNPASPVAVYLFERYFVSEYQDDKSFAAMLDTLMSSQPQNRTLMKLESDIKYSKRGNVGKKVPELSLKNRGKNDINIWQTGTDWTLLVFWATWMEGCYEFTDRMRQEYDRYKDGERLSVIAISLDTEVYRWEDFTRNDTLGIEHCCDGRAWDSSAVKQLGVGVLPCYILVDKKHNIVAKGTSASQMVDDLKKYIK